MLHSWQTSFAAAVAIVAAAGCAPRMVTRVTGSQDQVKLVYNRTTMLSYSTGIVQCKRDKDGNLTHCADMSIEFHKPND